jgi:hypothetical protein
MTVLAYRGGLNYNRTRKNIRLLIQISKNRFRSRYYAKNEARNYIERQAVSAGERDRLLEYADAYADGLYEEKGVR